MNNLIKDLILVASDVKESDDIRVEAMKTIQALRPDKSNRVISTKEAQKTIDTQMFEKVFEPCDQSDPYCQTLPAGSMSSIIYKKIGYEISRYRLKKLLKDRDCELKNTGLFCVKYLGM